MRLLEAPLRVPLKARFFYRFLFRPTHPYPHAHQDTIPPQPHHPHRHSAKTNLITIICRTFNKSSLTGCIIPWHASHLGFHQLNFDPLTLILILTLISTTEATRVQGTIVHYVRTRERSKLDRWIKVTIRVMWESKRGSGLGSKVTTRVRNKSEWWSIVDWENQVRIVLHEVREIKERWNYLVVACFALWLLRKLWKLNSGLKEQKWRFNVRTRGKDQLDQSDQQVRIEIENQSENGWDQRKN